MMYVLSGAAMGAALLALLSSASRHLRAGRAIPAPRPQPAPPAASPDVPSRGEAAGPFTYDNGVRTGERPR